MQNDNTRPIVIRRVTKKVAGHHGGAWKVAYADFVTALMAFFLLLWLLSMSEEDKLSGIAEFFSPNVVPLTNIGGEGVTMGSSLSSDELLGETSMSGLMEGREADDSEDQAGQRAQADAGAGSENPWSRFVEGAAGAGGSNEALVQSIREKMVEHALAVQVHERSGRVTIDLIDMAEWPLFDSSSAVLAARSAPLILEIAKILEDIGATVVITGHSDAAPFARDASYGNWELSVDRANAVRRALVAGGIAPGSVLRVSGAADTVPLDPADPQSARNRRVSIEIATGL